MDLKISELPTVTDDSSAYVPVEQVGDNNKILLSDYAKKADYQPLDSDLTAIAALSPSNDSIIQRKAGAWTDRSLAQVESDLIIFPRHTKVIQNPWINLSHTGNTTETIIGTPLLLPTGTLDVNDSLRLLIWLSNSTAANTKTVRAYFNTVPNLTGSPIQLLAGQATANASTPFVRNMFMRGALNSQRILITGSPGTLTDESTAANRATISVDFSVDQYLIWTLQLADGTQSATIEAIAAIIRKP